MGVVKYWLDRMRIFMRSLIGVVVGVFCVVVFVLVEMLVVIVEDVQGKVDGVEFMDYVVVGKIIKFGFKVMIMFSYFKSCVWEIISEGVVLVGVE